MTEKYREILRANYERALAQKINPECVTLTEGQFIDKFDPAKQWSVGPFKKDEKYTFEKTVTLNDPTCIGWTSAFIFNPSLMVKDDKLYLIYRVSVKKESLGSRIALAVYEEGKGWYEHPDPLLYPVEDDEFLSVEDPKVYRIDDGYVMFYNGIWECSEETAAKYGKADRICVDIKCAFSKDLIHWERYGLVVPYEVSRLWAKGAVIPRNERGEAVRINGKYMMLLSEGCGGKQTVGFSEDMRRWEWKAIDYLPLPKEMGRNIYEVACACVLGDEMVVDFFYNDNDGKYAGAQALYKLSDPFKPLDYSSNSTLAWGGLIKYRGKWIFAQGWDAPWDKEQMFFYTCDKK